MTLRFRIASLPLRSKRLYATHNIGFDGKQIWRAYARGRALQPPLVVLASDVVVDYRKFITVEPGKRGGKPCVRGLRITVGDVLGWIAAGMSWPEILDDYPDLTEQDIRACLAYAADREQHTMIALTPHEAAVRP